MAEGMDKLAVKPFYCVAFPITIDEHVLTTYEAEFTNRRQCCSIVTDGPMTVLDVCREEFEYILGVEGLEERNSTPNAPGNRFLLRRETRSNH